MFKEWEGMGSGKKYKEVEISESLEKSHDSKQ